MVVFLNGRFLPEEQATVSIFDRSFLYGDGLFETMRICRGRPFCWQRHWQRLERAAEFLKISLPFDSEALRAVATELAERNTVKEAVLRLTVSRGVGRRGYSPQGADRPAVVLSVHTSVALEHDELEDWTLVSSRIRLRPDDPLAGFKTCNRLPQILARREAEAAGAREAVLSNTDGWAVEGAASNLFWLQNGTVCTPPLASGILPGITREIILELCHELNLEAAETYLTLAQLHETEGVFLSLSSVGMAQAVSLDEKPLRQSQITERIHAAYLDRLHGESAGT